MERAPGGWSGPTAVAFDSEGGVVANSIAIATLDVDGDASRDVVVASATTGLARSDFLVNDLERFVRGDANDDGIVDVADPSHVLANLFGGEDLVAEAAADANDDDAIDTADAIYLLDYFFAFGPPPPAPFPEVSVDPFAVDPGTP